MRSNNPTLLALLAATALAGAAPAAQAQYVNGFYVSGGLGMNYLQDQDVSRNAAAGGGSGDISYEIGAAGVVALGWGYGNGIRAEIELNGRTNDVDEVSGFGGLGRGSGGGRVRQYGAMLNVWWDRDFGWPVIPAIGAGVGYGIADVDNARSGTLARIDDEQGNFAYQLMLGLALPLDAAGHFAATLEYRFYSILGDDFAVKGTTGKAELDDFRNHSVMVGLRYSFNPTLAPAAPAPVAAAPAPARTYLVFFDFAQATLTDRARGVIAEAANAARTTGSARIEVSGHTDTVGSAQYNQGLSMRRAEAVARELETRGVPRSSMVLQAFGFTRLLVPTGPNVREPQNRRVEIVLR
jgi:outer membrane protein OmpA-like peptidoglycan-associated protein